MRRCCSLESVARHSGGSFGTWHTIYLCSCDLSACLHAAMPHGSWSGKNPSGFSALQAITKYLVVAWNSQGLGRSQVDDAPNRPTGYLHN
jgi:hypothetical protein